jgi:predicted AAA+ superfamily ATPase
LRKNGNDRRFRRWLEPAVSLIYGSFQISIFLRHYPAYKNRQLNVSELARVYDLSRTTVYKYMDLLER